MRFRFKWDDGCIVYHPFRRTLVDEQSGRTRTIPVYERRQIHHAKVPQYAELKQRFRPNCLTVYTGHSCNLSCDYCYAGHSRLREGSAFHPEAVEAAALMTARNCRETGLPMILGFHGGTEPLLNADTIHASIEIVRKAAGKYRVPLQVFCTTNGVLPEATIQWARETFHGITLSWDGPDDVHDRHRKFPDGTGTARLVRQSAAVLGAGENSILVRTTVTQQTVEDMVRSLRFLAESGIRRMAFYPAYGEHGSTIRYTPDPGAFVRQYIHAGAAAEELGVRLTYPGSRVSETHGRYCSVFQNNMTLTPDGFLTACFQVTNNGCAACHDVIYGHYDSRENQLIVNWKKLHDIVRRGTRIRDRCRTCFNQLHCAMGCPDLCPVRNNPGDYDCTIERLIGLASLFVRAGYSWRYIKEAGGLDFLAAVGIEQTSEVTAFG